MPPKPHDHGATLAIVATVIIVIVLALLATFAYTKSTK
jgi:Tfp pilus assembly protein PilE